MRGIFMNRVTILIISVLMVFITPLFAAVPRVALVSLDDHARNVDDLVLGVWAKDLPVTFVERDKFQSVTEEIRLHGSKIASGDWVPNPQAMENADIFVILRDSGPAAVSSARNFAIVIFDAATGIRLIDGLLTDSTPINRARAVSAFIRTAISKRKKFQTDKLIKLAFLPLTPVNLSPEQLDAARQAETLIVRNSASCPDAIVLERRYLRYLVDEPNADVNELTKQLLTGSLLVRLTAAPKNGKIVLRLSFSAPGKDKPKSAITMVIDPAKPVEPQLKQALSAIPAKTSLPGADRQSEADDLYQQAYFAISHSLDTDALALAASSAALSDGQELTLADICIRSSARMLGSWGSVGNREKMDMVTRNLKTAVRMLDRHNCLGFSAMLFCDQWGYVSPRTFATLTPEQQQDMREVIGKLLELQYRELEKDFVIRMMNGGGTTIHEKFTGMNYRTKYLNQMDNVANQQWDLSYYARYIIPVLKRFVVETNALVPEMEKFYSLPEPERQQKYGHSTLEFLQNSHFARFYNADLAEQTETNKAVLREVFTLMTQSKLLELAWRGRLGLLRLEVKDYSRNGSEKSVDAVARYNAALIRCFETCSLPEGCATHLELDGPITQATRFRIQELSMERFAFYNPLNGGLLYYSWRQTLPPAEAPAYQKRLFGYITKFRNDRRVKLSPRDYAYTRDLLEGALRAIEQHFRLPSILGGRPIPDTPYSRFVEPLKTLGLSPDSMRPTEPCFDGRYIIFAIFGNDMTQMIKLDTEHDFAPIYGKIRRPVFGWSGTNMTGCLLDHYYVSWNYKYVYLYPLDGGEVQELDFGPFYEGSHLCMTGIGDRLFLSYGQFAGYARPGTVIEYHIKNKTTRIIVSTLDKSIDWPLKNQNWPYHIHQLVPDAKNHRILMLIHSRFFAYGFAGPPMKLYAYDYENGKWEALSGGLPIYEGQQGTIFCERNDIFVMAYSHGFGPVRKDKVWQPWLMENEIDGRLTDKVPQLPSNGDLALDYLHPAVIPGIRWGVDRMDFLNYADGVIYGEYALVDLKNKFFYQFKQRFRPNKVIGRKYVISWNSYNHGKALVIGVLKGSEQLKREAVK